MLCVNSVVSSQSGNFWIHPRIVLSPRVESPVINFNTLTNFYETWYEQHVT